MGIEGPSPQDKSDRRARIEFFVEQVAARYPGQIAAMASYGSVARGEDGPFSDIELFCVVDGRDEDTTLEWVYGTGKAEINIYGRRVARLPASKVEADWAVSQGQFVYARCIAGDPGLVDELKRIVLSASDDDIAAAIKETTVGERGIELAVRSWPAEKETGTMPSMFEIYERHAAEYAELVDAEDYQGNLARCLRQVTDWGGKRVLEAGVGTGRVTQLYAESAASIVCLDRSQHMMDLAASRLAAYEEKLHFRVADNMKLPRISPKFDLFIEGWSWGHSIVDSSQSVESTAEALLNGAFRNLRAGATLMLVETMGSNSAQPAAPHPRLARFYELLVNRYSFQQVVVQTDYRFPTADEAIRIMGFFFGDAMRDDLAAARPTVVPEWTGVWYATR